MLRGCKLCWGVRFPRGGSYSALGLSTANARGSSLEGLYAVSTSTVKSWVWYICALHGTSNRSPCRGGVSVARLHLTEGGDPFLLATRLPRSTSSPTASELCSNKTSQAIGTNTSAGACQVLVSTLPVQAERRPSRGS